MTEAEFRSRIYMAAVCRCFPGKLPAGGDRVPSEEEIHRCSYWLHREIAILRPALVLPVGRLAIAQFIPVNRLDEVIGRRFNASLAGRQFDLIPLPHPSGASPWHRTEPGRTLLRQALGLVNGHPAFQGLLGTNLDLKATSDRRTLEPPTHATRKD